MLSSLPNNDLNKYFYIPIIYKRKIKLKEVKYVIKITQTVQYSQDSDLGLR